MPNRWVREDAIESEAVNAVSWLGEVFFRRLINRVDDFGRYTANLKLLRSKLFPLQFEKVTERDLTKLLKECEAAGLLFTYAGPDGKPYLILNKWEKGRAKNSKYPSQPEEICKQMQTFVYRCEQTQTFPPTSDFRLPIPSTDPDSDRPPADVGKSFPALGLRIGGWFKRRESTSWSDKEMRALQKVLEMKTPEEDVLMLEKRYASGDPYLRKDILTLLNNWNGEIDRARQSGGPKLLTHDKNGAAFPNTNARRPEHLEASRPPGNYPG